MRVIYVLLKNTQSVGGEDRTTFIHQLWSKESPPALLAVRDLSKEPEYCHASSFPKIISEAINKYQEYHSSLPGPVYCVSEIDVICVDVDRYSPTLRTVYQYWVDESNLLAEHDSITFTGLA